MQHEKHSYRGCYLYPECPAWSANSNVYSDPAQHQIPSAARFQQQPEQSALQSLAHNAQQNAQANGNHAGLAPSDAPRHGRQDAVEASQQCVQDDARQDAHKDTEQSATQDAEKDGPSPGSTPTKRAPIQPPLGPDNTNRKNLDLPPVIGGKLRYANKTLKYRPFPADVDEVRDMLFKLDQPVLLDSQQIADYWTHMSSVWVRSTKPVVAINNTVVESWECRNSRRIVRREDPPKSTGKRQRTSKLQLLGDMPSCKVRIKLTSFTKHAENQDPPCEPGLFQCKCVPEWLYIDYQARTRSEHIAHTHDIGTCNMMKRSQALMYFCKVKCEESYSPAAVYKWVKEKYGPNFKEVEHLSKHDLANVTRFWRAANPDAVLKSKVEENDPVQARREECMDAIESTSANRLRRALAEVCRRLPDAIEIILSFLETPGTIEEGEATEIAQGDKIRVPEPGLPKRRYMDGKGWLFEPDPKPPESTPQGPTVNVQVNGETPPTGPHLLHVPVHLVDRFISSQSRPSQLPPPGSGRPPGSRLSLPTPSSDPNVASREFLQAATKTTQHDSPYPRSKLPLPSVTRQYPPDRTSHGLPSSANGIVYDRPSWALPANRISQKRIAEAPPIEHPRPTKRASTTDDINVQLEMELEG